MNPLSRLRALAQELARQNAPHRSAPKKFDLSAAIQTANLQDLPPQVWPEFETLLDHDLACALARVMHAVVERNRLRRARALTDLTLVRALNMCGEFHHATRLCPDAARRFEKQGDTENVVRVWLEAAWAATYLGDLHAAENGLERIRAIAPSLASATVSPRRGAAVMRDSVTVIILWHRH